MTDALAEEQQRLASSRYAQIIVALWGLIVLALIAADRQSADTLRMRHELVARRAHAQEMIARVESLAGGDDLFLINLCYATLGGDGAVHRMDDGRLYPQAANEVPTGILGNYKRTATVALSNRWGLPQADFIRAAAELAEAVKPVLVLPADVDVLKSKLEEVVRSASTKLSAAAQSVDLFTDTPRELANALVESRGVELSKEEVAWIVTGRVTPFEPDPESRDAPRLGLGYVEEPRAISDLPVFSAYALTGSGPSQVVARLREYQTTLETALLSRAATESPIEIFGSGVSLRLSDLVVFAGPLIVLFQVLYLIALGQEAGMRAAPRKKGEPAYAAFPRFSSPADPLRSPRPHSPEAAVERTLYAVFLVLPPAILIFAWLTNFNLTGFRDFMQSPFWSVGFSLREISKPDNAAGFAASLYVGALVVSCYALHRSLLVGRRELPAPRWTRAGVVWRASLVTAGFALGLVWGQGQYEYYTGCAVFVAAAAVAGTADQWPERKRLTRWLTLGLCLLAVAVGIAGVVLGARGDVQTARLWNPWFFVFPAGANVLAPLWGISAGFFAALRRRQRLPFYFFLIALGATVIALLH